MQDTTNGGRELAYRQLHDSEELHRATLTNISDAVSANVDDITLHELYVWPFADAVPLASTLGGFQFRRGLASPRPCLRLRLRAPARQAAFLRHRPSRDASQWAGVAAAGPPAAPPD